MKLLRAWWRLGRVGWHIAVGFTVIVWRFPRLSVAQREMRIQAWSLELLAHLAIKLVVNGQPPQAGPVLLVVNHISWLDIAVMHAARHCRFVSKADVQRWPVVGTLAGGAGTLFIERNSRRDARRVVHYMTECLRQGDVLAVFPEGTTGDGTTVLPFHANLLQAAIAAQVPAQPVALHFADEASGTMSFAPCYIGDDTLLQSLWRTLKTSGIVAVVSFGVPQLAQDRDRRAWADDLREAVVALRGEVTCRADRNHKMACKLDEC
jgi:1-acyl-sn-glycerol-3-phosphate acyltransferase